MIELIVLAFIVRRIGALVEDRGHKARWYKVLTVVLWFGGEVLGIFIGISMSGGDSNGYIIGLLGAAVGVGIAYAIADNLEYVETADLTSATLDKP